MLQLSPLVYLVGDGFNKEALPKDALALPVLPSKAFGDGSHPTTRICAGAVDMLCRQKPRSVLDVGTGTGVLARIARARGASFVAATDIDPVALESARQHIALDHHTLEIPVLNEMPDHWGQYFDLVVANILEEPLKSLAPYLASALVPNGILLLSGITPLQVSGLRVHFSAQDLIYENESRLHDWSLMMFRKP